MVGVVAGDTVDVRLEQGVRERVRLLGVRAPVAGSCLAQQARSATRGLLSRRLVTLSADRAVPARDGSGRLLAYVTAGRSGDLGRTLLARGLGQVDVEAPTFGRFLSYVPVQRRAETSGRGIWKRCAADVAVTISASPAEPVVGAEVAYQVRVTNRGPLAAPGVVLELRPPGATPLVSAVPSSCRVEPWVGSCSFRRLAAGATATATLTADVTRAGLVSARVAARFDWCIRAVCGVAPLRDSNATNGESALLVTALADSPPAGPPPTSAAACHPSYPTLCIPPPPPLLVCADIPFRDFYVKRDVADPDPHQFDKSEDGIGCQFDDY